MNTMKTTFLALVLSGLLGTVPAHALEVFLRAAPVTVSMPCGETVTSWGFAIDSSLADDDGVVTSPGPVIRLTPGDTTLTVNLKNRIPGCPFSLVIPGQRAVPTPVRHMPPYDPRRVRSFTSEVMPMANGVYTWTDLRAGTFVYHSGTHPSCHVQMGLFGALVVDESAGEAYPDVFYDRDVVLVYSDVDPEYHAAVVSGNYGMGKTVTSPIGYRPRYFLVNGEVHDGRIRPVVTGDSGETVLFRLVNASFESKAPQFKGAHFLKVAEDGFERTYPERGYALGLPALKTSDVLVTGAPDGMHSIIDRGLKTANSPVRSGGQISHFVLGSPYFPGDLNGDGTIWFDDVQAFLTNFGVTGLCPPSLDKADLDGDGDVDWDDFSIQALNYGATGIPHP